MRSTRKQLQAIMHFVSGNLEMRVNSSSAQPSTYFLSIATFVGKGKSVYYGFLTKLMELLKKGVHDLDKQIFEKTHPSRNSADEGGEGKNAKKDEPKFKARTLLHGPGTKEGWENALHNENRVIQICDEGDL